jgi:hypothetical protein
VQLVPLRRGRVLPRYDNRDVTLLRKSGIVKKDSYLVAYFRPSDDA